MGDTRCNNALGHRNNCGVIMADWMEGGKEKALKKVAEKQFRNLRQKMV